MNIKLNKGIIEYEERGTGYPLIAIHGYFPDRRLMIGALEPVFDNDGHVIIPPSAALGLPSGGKSKKSYRRIYPDLPFMGKSDNPENVRNSDDMLEIMIDFIKNVVPEGPFILAGESYGGYLARGMVKEFKNRIEGIFFLCPGIVAEISERDIPENPVFRTEPDYSENATETDIKMFEGFSIIRNKYTFERSMKEVISGVQIARKSQLENLRNTGFAFSNDKLKMIIPSQNGISEKDVIFDEYFDRPVLFLLGRQDLSVGWKDALRISELYPRATYAILDLAGHNLQIEQTGIHNALIGEWIGRCEIESVEHH